jgi:thiol-disulfide isomerase/thioredoxin
MALTPSTMLPLGTPLPLEVIRAELAAGSTQQVSGTPLDLGGPGGEALAGRPVLVLFLCAHCPFVKHIEPELTRLAGEHAGGARPDGLQLIGISSNSTLTHPQDGPEGLRAQAAAHHWTFPYLFDGDQALAKAFQAACTPDLFLFGADHRLAYRGQLDASRPGNDLPCDGRDLRAAIAAVLAGEPVPEEQRPSIGCNIKWHPDRGPVVRAT